MWRTRKSRFSTCARAEGMDALEKCRLKQVHLNRNLRSGERHSEDLTLTAEED
jgi:hypothetical protein